MWPTPPWTPDFARGFLLYELYIRAAGFESLSE